MFKILTSTVVFFVFCHATLVFARTGIELEKFIKKDGSCFLAIATTPFPLTPRSDPNKIKFETDTWSSRIMCVGDFKLSVGTLDEVSGCTFAVYDAEKRKLISSADKRERVKGLHKSGFAVVEKPCARGGFEDLLKFNAGGLYGTVEQALTKGPQLGASFMVADGDHPALAILYSKTSSTANWWRERTKVKVGRIWMPKMRFLSKEEKRQAADKKRCREATFSGEFSFTYSYNTLPPPEYVELWGRCKTAAEVKKFVSNPENHQSRCGYLQLEGRPERKQAETFFEVLGRVYKEKTGKSSPELCSKN